MIRGFITRLIVWVLALAALCAVLFYEAVHHRYIILALFFAFVFAVLFYRAVLAAAPRRDAGSGRCAGGSGSGSGRARGTHPCSSSCSGGAAWRRCTTAAAPGPGSSFWRRMFLSCATAYAVRLGRAQYCRRVYARMEDQILVLAPQRTGKSGLIADQILGHPGPVLATSTRPDLYKITAGSRAQRGPL